MSRGILVIDMPDYCVDCQFCYEYDEGIEACCLVTREPENEDLYREIKEDYCQCRPSWCPLKELPEKMKYCNGTYNGEVKGWNLCLEKILEDGAKVEGA